MSNILTYLETEFATFEEKPFNAVDSLVLSQFCMARMEGIVPPMRDMGVLGGMGSFLQAVLAPREEVYFHHALRAEKFPDMFTGLKPEKIKDLVMALAASPRFRQMELREYAVVFNEGEATQFAALTFVYKNQFAYIGFRGTDSSFTGWREDFDMAYMDQVPSQAQAVKYLETVAPRLPKCLYVGGHSKGGNLAVYGGLKACDRVRSRIQKIYNHDGPGFRPGVLTERERAMARALVDKTVPQESIVGTLLEHEGDYRVVKSTAKGVEQHDPFTWEISNGTLVPMAELTPSARFLDDVLDEWLVRYDRHEMHAIVDALFGFLQSSDAKDLSDFFAGGSKTWSYLRAVAANADESSKAALLEAAAELSSVAVKRAFRQQ